MANNYPKSTFFRGAYSAAPFWTYKPKVTFVFSGQSATVFGKFSGKNNDTNFMENEFQVSLWFE